MAGGRPAEAMKKLEDRKEEFERHMQYYPTKLDIAGTFNISESTVDRFVKKYYQMSFDDFRDKRFGKTRTALRQKQIQRALEGSDTMLVWCGKNFLGQTDKAQSSSVLTVEDLRDIKINWGDEADAPTNAATNAPPKKDQ